MRRVTTNGHFLAALATVGLCGCLAGYQPIGGDGTGNGSGGPNGLGPVDPKDLEGAGGRDLTEFWDAIDVPLSQNTKMLAFDMMQSEVQRATGQSWVVAGQDQWARNQAALGGADYTTTFVEDRAPSQGKIVLWRKMAFQVCQDLVTKEAGQATRAVFTDVDPGAALTPADAKVQAQITNLFQRFYLEAPTPVDLTESTTLLTDLLKDTSDPKQAWRFLCVGYLGSTRFLSY